MDNAHFYMCTAILETSILSKSKGPWTLMMKFNNVFTQEAPGFADLFSDSEGKVLHVNL